MLGDNAICDESGEKLGIVELFEAMLGLEILKVPAKNLVVHGRNLGRQGKKRHPTRDTPDARDVHFFFCRSTQLSSSLTWEGPFKFGEPSFAWAVCCCGWVGAPFGNGLKPTADDLAKQHSLSGALASSGRRDVIAPASDRLRCEASCDIRVLWFGHASSPKCRSLGCIVHGIVRGH